MIYIVNSWQMLVFNECCFERKWGDFPVVSCSTATSGGSSASSCTSQSNFGYPCACINDVTLYKEMEKQFSDDVCGVLANVMLAHNKPVIGNPNVTAGE